jgi:hypothetical protein
MLPIWSDAHAETGLPHPPHQKVAAPLVLVGQREAGEPAPLRGADPTELLDAGLKPRAIDPHVASQRRL